MSTLPIMFSPESVQAILSGKKTMTRRVVEPAYPDRPDVTEKVCPFGYPSSIPNHPALLWVQEPWREEDGKILYKADQQGFLNAPGWRHASSMPYWASRIKLEIASVRLERLKCITVSDVLKEGFDSIAEFSEAWETINGYRGYGWDVNSFVWIIEFRKYEVCYVSE